MVTPISDSEGRVVAVLLVANKMTKAGRLRQASTEMVRSASVDSSRSEAEVIKRYLVTIYHVLISVYCSTMVLMKALMLRTTHLRIPFWLICETYSNL
jgi:hypothetical protein